MQHINNTPADSGLGDTLKVAFDKVNANFEELVAIDSSFSGDIQTLNTIISDGSTLNHTHTISQIIGLQTALSGKVSTSTFNTQILAINASIQAINNTLSTIIDILDQLETEKVPYTGATRNVDLNTKSLTAGGGLFVSPFSGNTNNRAEFATPYGGNSNFRQIVFYNYGDDIEFSLDKSIEINANIEEGFAVSVRDINGQLASIAANYSAVNLQVNNDTDSNLIQVLPSYTDFSRRLYTAEGFEGNYVQFNTGATETSLPGKLKWNDVDGTLDLGLKGGNVTLQIGQEQLVRVVNKTATNITLQESAYQAVRVTGAQGQRLKVDLALANNDLNSAETIGLVTETILNNQEGFVTISGLVNKINTTGSLQGETWNDGDILYLSPITAGRITNVKPSAPSHLVVIGYVIYAHSNNGKIFVKVDNGYELDELHNVQVSGATNGQVLTYSAATQLWVPTTPSSTGSSALSGLTDVTISSGVTTGSTLMYNGSVWSDVDPFDYFDAKPVISQKHVNLPVFGGAGFNNVEGVAFIGGGATARNWADTDLISRSQRVGLVISTTGNLASIRQASNYISRNGGFDTITAFNMAENATDTAIRFYIGITILTSFSNVEPNTLLNIIGVCRLSTSNNLHLVHNDGTGTATTVDLGADFPANTISSDKYNLRIKTVSNGVYVQLDRVGTPYTYNTIITTDIPSADTGLRFGAYIVDTTGASVATGFDWYGTYTKI